MSYKISAVIATDKVDWRMERFSKDALIEIAETVVGKPIFKECVTYEEVGKITDAAYDDGKVRVSGTLDFLPPPHLYLTPVTILDIDGCEYDEHSVFTIEHGVSIGVLPTADPCDPDITPIEVDEHERE